MGGLVGKFREQRFREILAVVKQILCGGSGVSISKAGQ
jgi:hypothetical protein